MHVRYNTAPYGMGAWIMTMIAFIILAAITALAIIIETSEAQRVTILYFLGVIWVLVLGIGSWAPRCYEVSEKTITINRLVGDIVIPKVGIKSIKIVEQIPIGIRALGSGGVFGYFGGFLLTTGEPVTVYCTRTDHVVVIKTDLTVYVISPSDPEGFCNAVGISESEIEP